jgi:hypothetical protein
MAYLTTPRPSSLRRIASSRAFLILSRYLLCDRPALIEYHEAWLNSVGERFNAMYRVSEKPACTFTTMALSSSQRLHTRTDSRRLRCEMIAAPLIASPAARSSLQRARLTRLGLNSLDPMGRCGST